MKVLETVWLLMKGQLKDKGTEEHCKTRKINKEIKIKCDQI
jgi:hypothetical protein